MRPSSDTQQLVLDLKQQAIELGFPLVGIAPAVSPARLTHFLQWLDSGYAGQMSYLENRRSAYQHPSSILEGCQSLVMLGTPYLFSESQRAESVAQPGSARVARYAQSPLDYHDVIRQRLKSLKKWLIQQCPGAKIRGVIDTAPLLEREFAQLAGLGWVGKNTLLLNRQWGSYFFLAALLTDIALPGDESHQSNHCGTCTACLDQCPTQAFVSPYVLDATRCLSYVTIENHGPVSPSLGTHLNDWIFGCDICQEVCPWNRKSDTTTDAAWQPADQLRQLDVLEILELTEEQFRERFRPTPLWRPRWRGLIRNAILVAGAQQMTSAIAPLSHKLTDEEQLIRSSAAWALGQIGGAKCAQVLGVAIQHETNSDVRTALAQALRKIETKS